ncbi:TPA: pyridoxal phosphate-dependent aminotransferase [Streptococcus suis]|nr:pyridoxal phosphate-dependent aminotransferase [Streptococcus suis]
MTYDFKTLPNRLDQHSEKWRLTENNPELLQLWVADMDFQPFPEMRQAIVDYGQRQIFGYNYASESLFESIMDWEKEQHGYCFDRQALVLVEGVVPALSIAVQAFTAEGDAVMINTPVYPPFARTVRLNHRRLISQPLSVENDQFTIDFRALEQKIVEEGVKLYIFCNPHNPGGRVWSRQELHELGAICQKHGVILVSDEIHQDLTLFGHEHHSFNTVSPNHKEFSVILSSATKTFNIAGTKNSFAIIENPQLRKAFTKRQLANNQHEIPSLGLITTEVAYRHGKPWLAALKPVLEENILLVQEELSKKTNIKVLKPQGTYLIWLDFSAYEPSHQELAEKLMEEAQLHLNDGLTFGKEGEKHFRLNAATPQFVIKEACRRLVEVFGCLRN